jgi:hypothetical protein
MEAGRLARPAGRGRPASNRPHFDSGCRPYPMLESTRLADQETTEWSPGRIQVESGIENIEFP